MSNPETLDREIPKRITAAALTVAAGSITAAAIQTAKVDAGDKAAVAAYFRDIFHLLFEPGTTN